MMEAIKQRAADSASGRKIKEEQARTKGKLEIINAAKGLVDSVNKSDEPVVFAPITEMLNRLIGHDDKKHTWIDESNMKRLRFGKLPADQIDLLIDNLKSQLSIAGRYSDEMKSDIWASIAIYEKARGNKKPKGKKSGPGKMDSALKESRSYNENNITALKCELSYLWEKHPSQFREGKINQHEHMREQVSKCVEILERLLAHDEIEPEESVNFAGMYLKALETMKKDEIEPEKYVAKYDGLFDMIAGNKMVGEA